MPESFQEKHAPPEPDREYLKIWGPVILITIIGLIVAWGYVEPAPPDRIRLATGAAGGAYDHFGHLYRAELAKSGITLEVVESAGSVENLKLLLDGKCDIAFLQGGITNPQAEGTVESLASLYFEPLWVFHRAGLQITHLTDLAGLRIGVGEPESGTEALARRLLTANGVTEQSARFELLDAEAAAAALTSNGLDAAFFVSGWDAPVIQNLVKDPSIALMSFERDEAYQSRFVFLSSVMLPEGAVDLVRNIPPRDTILLSPTANLVARTDLHPALIDLLVSAAEKAHHAADMFAEPGEFPSDQFLDFPLRDEARRSLTQGPKLVNRVLPFWIASIVDRMAVLLLPLLTLLVPLFKVAPPLYRWRVRRKIYRWYKYLREVDTELVESDTLPDVAGIRAHLEELEQELVSVNVPLSYMDEFYHLKVHIALVREKLGRIEKKGPAQYREEPAPGAANAS